MIKQEIERIFIENKQRYGYRRILLVLRGKGIKLNHKTVHKLMRSMGLHGKRRKSKYKSYKGEVGKIAPNILNRDFATSKPYEKLATDVTEFAVCNDKVYLSPIIDLHNNEVISYSISTSPNFWQTKEMLKGLFDKLPKGAKPILHSDQGWQYQMKEFQRQLKEHNIMQSMSRKGNCLDNSVMENFFGRLKVEMFYGILRKEQYIGIHHHDGEVYTNIYPPIVPKPLYDRVQSILAKNRIGSRSNLTDYLLRDKAICGYCGKTLQGESGTARNGTVKHYYKCMGRKKYHICSKSVVPKDRLENIVISEAIRAFSRKDIINEVAEAIINAHAKKVQDQSILNVLTTEHNTIKKSLSNILKAIEQGIFTETTKARMEELENQLAETENIILIEQYKTETQLKLEHIVEYITHSIRQAPKLLVHTLIQKVILWDDKIEIYFNFTEKTNPDEQNHRDSLELTGSDSSRVVQREGICTNYLIKEK